MKQLMSSNRGYAFFAAAEQDMKRQLVVVLGKGRQEAWFPMLQALKLEPVPQRWKSVGEGGSSGSSSMR